MEKQCIDLSDSPIIIIGKSLRQKPLEMWKWYSGKTTQFICNLRNRQDESLGSVEKTDSSIGKLVFAQL